MPAVNWVAWFLTDLYLNGTKMNNFDWNTVSVEGNVRPYNDSGLYVMSFENGITARINANFDLEMMTLETIAEPSLAGKLRGLLGIYIISHPHAG